MSQTPKYSMNYKSGLVSVIVRTKDRPEFLSHALASVSKQTYRPIEIVLVNDGGESVDAIVQEVSSADIELKILNNPSSLGRTEAASQGLELASGEFSVFLDDDDYFDPEHLSSLMEGMNTLSKEENGLHVVYSGARAVLVDRNEEHLISIQAEPFSFSRLQYGNFIPILAALFPTWVRELGVKFDTDFDLFEDWDFWLQVAQHCHFHFLGGASCAYRIHNASSTVRDQQSAIATYKQIYGKWLSSQSSDERMLDVLANSHIWHETFVSRLQSENQKALDKIGKLHQKALDTISNKDQDISKLTGLHQDALKTIEQKDRDINRVVGLYHEALAVNESKDKDLVHLDGLQNYALSVISTKDGDIEKLSGLHAEALSVIASKDKEGHSLANLYEGSVVMIETLEKELSASAERCEALQIEKAAFEAELERHRGSKGCLARMFNGFKQRLKD
mgnify:CR=1 FL=1